MRKIKTEKNNFTSTKTYKCPKKHTCENCHHYSECIGNSHKRIF